MPVSRTTKTVSTPVHLQLGLPGLMSDVPGEIPSNDIQDREAKARIFAEDWMYKLRDNPNLLDNPNRWENKFVKDFLGSEDLSPQKIHSYFMPNVVLARQFKPMKFSINDMEDFDVPEGLLKELEPYQK